MDLPTEQDLSEHFSGYVGQQKLAAAVTAACEYAKAQAPRQEIAAALAVAHPEWPDGLANRVVEYAAQEILQAALAARAEMRLEIFRAAADPGVKPGQIALLKAWAFEHLDWHRDPIDKQVKDALADAEKTIASGGMQ